MAFPGCRHRSFPALSEDTIDRLDNLRFTGHGVKYAGIGFDIQAPIALEHRKACG